VILRQTVLMIILCGAIATSLHAAVHVEKISYKGWQNCYRVNNGEAELIVTGDVGPRVIRFGFVGGQNLFKEYPEQLGACTGRSIEDLSGFRMFV
jgi:hypothetical protein